QCFRCLSAFVYQTSFHNAVLFMRTTSFRALAQCGVTGLLLCAAFLGSAQAQTTRYVSVAGSDAGDCSNAGNPCQSIGYAVTQAVGGDAIQVGPGTYAESVAASKSLTFNGIGQPVIQVASNTNGFYVTANDVTIEGFVLAGPHADPFHSHD